MRRCFVFLTMLVTFMSISSSFAMAQKESPAGGGWIEFNGNSFVAAEDDDSLDANLEEFTIEVWIHPKDSIEKSDEWVIIVKPGSYELLLVGGGHRFIANRGVKFAIFFGHRWTGGMGFDIMDANLLGGRIFNEWHHIAVSGGGKTQLCLYFDGQWRGFNPKPKFLANSSSDLYIGGIKSWSNSFFEGAMDEIRISNVARLPQIQGPLKSDKNTVVLWHFDEVKGATTFKDASGNGHTLSKQGLAFFSVEPADKLTTTWGALRNAH